MQFKWSHNATLFLLAEIKKEYTQLQTGIKKRVYEKIADACNKSGINVSWVQVESKWKALQRQYKLIKDHNNTSGQNKKTWVYLDTVDEIMARDPSIMPLSTTCSTNASAHFNFDETAYETTSAVNERKRKKHQISKEQFRSKKLQLMEEHNKDFKRFVDHYVKSTTSRSET